MSDEFAEFMNSFHRLTGIDLARYKRPQMERRLTNLRDRRGFHTYSEYLDILARDKTMLDEFLDKMTINVSEFFRNPDRWEQLASLLSDRAEDITAWSAACSTGEEPYSLAMLCKKYDIGLNPILATDIDERVLQHAKNGVYDETQLRHTDDEYVRRFFDSQGKQYVVKPSASALVQFQKHNLLSDDYPSRVDLIICRNVLIYFTEETKQVILRRFAQSLNPGGFLFVGSTEQFIGLDLHGLKLVSPFIYQMQSGVHR